MFENAKWITTRYGGPDLDIKPAPFFRKEFTLKQEVKSATVYICALGYGEYYINGEKIHQDVLTTPYTNYDKTVLYNKYDVTRFLTSGKNVFGVIVGNGPYHVAEANSWKDACQTWTANPKFIMQLEVEYVNGEAETIVSDTTCVWTTAEIIYDEWKMAEIHDNRLAIKDWSKPSFDASGWNKSFVGFPPGGKMTLSYIPPIMITDEFPMKKIAENIYDCGQNLSGWVNLKVKGGKSGQEISIIYSERFENGDISTQDIIGLTQHPEKKHIDKVILSGDGEEEFEPKFVYHGFRYIKLVNAPKDVTLTAKFLHTDIKTVADFSCSDATLNELHRMIKWATLSNYHAVPTDCPHREQNGWMADAYLSAQQVLMNYDIDASYTKFVHDIVDCQKESGQLPCVVPQSSWGYNWGSCPGWDTPLFYFPYYMYQINGNKDIIEYVYPYCERYMNFANMMQQGFIVYDGLGDWVAPLETTNKCEPWIIETAFYYAFSNMMAEFSRVLGKDASKYETLAKNIRKAFREKYFVNGTYANDSQTALACV
ncbi:MAG: family 78 glycoside hydrolase catalytic domain, partial [Clostridia bacterium]|nr:family 78 glycoside hydrolase catalytic domain [Clostridia bacterium]